LAVHTLGHKGASPEHFLGRAVILQLLFRTHTQHLTRFTQQPWCGINSLSEYYTNITEIFGTRHTGSTFSLQTLFVKKWKCFLSCEERWWYLLL